jgi:hypothetical protein
MQNALPSESFPLLLILVGAVFVHACFQISVSVLTRLSSHTIGTGKSQRRLLSLSLCYILGVVIATASVVLGVSAKLAWLSSIQAELPGFIVVGLLPIVGLLVILFYYRRDKGTKLWLPRPFVDYLMERAKKTRSGVEASMLGAATVVGELPFILAPVGIASLWISTLDPSASWLALSLGYAFVVSLPLVFLALYISSGHKISEVQNWRERNKLFLQWTSGASLVLLAVFIMSYHLKGAL